MKLPWLAWAFTACDSTADPLPEYDPSPEYTAVIECVPVESDVVAKLAEPPETVAEPRELPPSRKSTVPDAADGETVAVNVTFCPNVDGFADDVTLVDVPTGPPTAPQVENRNDVMRVFQLIPPLGRKYSLVYQNVQSSLGSTDRLV